MNDELNDENENTEGWNYCFCGRLATVYSSDLDQNFCSADCWRIAREETEGS